MTEKEENHRKVVNSELTNDGFRLNSQFSMSQKREQNPSSLGLCRAQETSTELILNSQLKRRVALYVRYLADQYCLGESPRQQLQVLADLLHESGIETEEVTDHLPDRQYDFLFSIGGDGTLLSAVHLIGSRNIPVLGINFGHLGFLTTAGRDDLDTLVADLLAGRYTVEPRTLLHISTEVDEAPQLQNSINFKTPSTSKFQTETYALNEVTLHRLDDGTLLHTDLFVDNDFVATYSGDGLIVATPTGSTAYSLSCGGPILTPNSGCFVVTPIGAHNLTLRPIIVPDSAQLRLVTHQERASEPSLFNLSMDSRRQHLPCGTEIRLSREAFTISLVRLHGQSFFSAIHQKLGWNAAQARAHEFTHEAEQSGVTEGNAVQARASNVSEANVDYQSHEFTHEAEQSGITEGSAAQSESRSQVSVDPK